MKRLRLLTMLGCLVAGIASAATPPLPRDSVYPLPVTLTDQDARTTTLADRRGTPQLVSMFYTSCTMVCPMIIDTMKLTRKAAGNPAGERLQLLAVSFDPSRDSVAALREYAARHKLDLQHWTLARTDQRDTRQLSAVLGLQYRQLPDGNFNHSSQLILLDRDGRIVARSTVIGRLDAEFVEQVRKLVGP